MKPRTYFWIICLLLTLARMAQSQPPDVPAEPAAPAPGWAEVEAECRAARAAAPKDPGVMARLVRLLLRQERIEEAWQEAKPFADANPENALAQALLGDVHAAQGQDEAARTQYQQAEALDPRSPDAHFGLALLLERPGQRQEAQAEWQRFLELAPNDERAWFVRERLVVVRRERMTPPGAREATPAWSPDGKWILADATRGGRFGVWRIQVAPPHKAELFTSSPHGDCHAAWSPDGRQIVFDRRSAPGERVDVFVRENRAEAEATLMLRHEEGSAWNPRWSPDGTRLIYHSWNGLFFVHVEIMDKIPLPLPPGTQESADAHWSPDGTQIVFTGVRSPTEADVYVCAAAADAVPIQMTKAGACYVYPSFSPDGQKITFGRKRDPEKDGYASYVEQSTCDLWVKRVDVGEAERPLLPDVAWADWSPDGLRLVGDDAHGQLSLVTLGGLEGCPLRLTTVGTAQSLTVQVVNRSAEVQRFDLSYRLFDDRSRQVAGGVLGEPQRELKPGETWEIPLPQAPWEPGRYTLKLTALTTAGEAIVELMDLDF